MIQNSTRSLNFEHILITLAFFIVGSVANDAQTSCRLIKIRIETSATLLWKMIDVEIHGDDDMFCKFLEYRFLIVSSASQYLHFMQKLIRKEERRKRELFVDSLSNDTLIWLEKSNGANGNKCRYKNNIVVYLIACPSSRLQVS